MLDPSDVKYICHFAGAMALEELDGVNASPAIFA